MHSLTKPSYIFDNIFKICVNSRQDPVKKRLLLAKKDAINSAVANYDDKMKLQEGHSIKTIINDASENKELNKLYSDKMVSGPARCFYNKILMQSKNKDCCFCSYQDPVELDHFLPKTKFPEFSVAPINLVPVCQRCNKAKSDHFPESIENSFIHPYYETCTEDSLWLGASVSFKDNSPIVVYFILDSTNQPLKKRLEFQFSTLYLYKRYSLQTARELTSRKKRWEEAKNCDGIEGVKIDLSQEYVSESQNNQNSWKSALYSSLLSSDEFCEMNWDI